MKVREQVGAVRTQMVCSRYGFEADLAHSAIDGVCRGCAQR